MIDLDLKSDLRDALSRTPFDMVVHFAGVTHASDEQQYWNVNLEGTRRLAEATREVVAGVSSTSARAAQLMAAERTANRNLRPSRSFRDWNGKVY